MFTCESTTGMILSIPETRVFDASAAWPPVPAVRDAAAAVDRLPAVKQYGSDADIEANRFLAVRKQNHMHNL